MKKQAREKKQKREIKRKREFRIYPIAISVVVLLAVGNLLGLSTLFLPEISLLDEGQTSMAAWRISEGQVPYRDFFNLMTPLSFYVLAGAYKVLSASFMTGRLVGVLFGLLLLLLTYLISARVFKERAFILYPMSALIMAGVGVWCFPSHHWLVNILQLASMLALLKSCHHNSPRWAGAAGGLAGVAVWALQDQGAFFFLATVAVTLPVLAYEKRVKLAGWWLAAFGVSALLLLGMLLTVCPFRWLWDDLVKFPLTSYRGEGVNDITLTRLVAEILKPFAPANLARAPILNFSTGPSWLFLLANHLLAAALLSWRFFKDRAARVEVSILASGVLAFAATFLRRPGLINLYWAAVPAAIATGYSLAWLATGSRYRQMKRWCYALLVLAVISFSLHGAVRFHDQLAGDKEERVSTPAGPVKMLKSDSRSFSEFMTAVSNLVPDGEPMVPFGGLPMVCFLTRHPNPIGYDLISRSTYTTQEQAEEIIRAAEAKGVRWGVYFDVPLGDSPIENYLRENFEPAWRNGEFMVVRRRAP